MKTSRAFALAGAALVAGFFAACFCFAQSSDQTSRKEPASYGFGALERLTSFVTYLQDTKQTNTLQQFNDYTIASLATQHYADLGTTLAIFAEVEGWTHQLGI